MSRPSAKASISPSTRSAPTTCDPPGCGQRIARAQNYGLGTYPAMPRPLRGSSASWSPFLFDRRAEEKDCHSRPRAQEYRPQRKHREIVMHLEGGCYCGEVRYVADGDPMMQAQCHCRECQFITGGAPNTFIAMPAGGFSYTKGQPNPFTRKGLERAVTREFCPECGTQLVTKVPGLPAEAVKGGT